MGVIRKTDRKRAVKEKTTNRLLPKVAVKRKVKKKGPPFTLCYRVKWSGDKFEAPIPYLTEREAHTAAAAIKIQSPWITEAWVE